MEKEKKPHIEIGIKTIEADRVLIQNRRKQCDHGGRDWSDAGTSQGVRVAREAGRGKKQFPLETQEGVMPCRHLDSCPGTRILDFWPPELGGNALRSNVRKF